VHHSLVITVVYLAVWHSGSVICCINKITVCRAQLILERVTTSGWVYHLGM